MNTSCGLYDNSVRGTKHSPVNVYKGQVVSTVLLGRGGGCVCVHPGRVVVSCWAGFRPSAGGSEPSTDKTGSTCHCVVSFVMLGNLLNTATKQKTCRCVSLCLDGCDGTYLMSGTQVSVSKPAMCWMCRIQVIIRTRLKRRGRSQIRNVNEPINGF